MLQFEYRNPTRLVFGTGMISELTRLAPQLGTKLLLVYGGGSIKTNGVYEQVVSAFKNAGIGFVEFSGIEPNPRHSTIEKAITECRLHRIEGVLAVGGGSVIDAAKAIAAGACYEGNVWEIVTGQVVIKQALPLGTVLTLAATGTEMNSNSVISNWDTREKIGWSSPHVYPQFSILDASTTCSVPLNHTVYGIVDIMSHVLEQYMHHIPNTPIQDQFAEAILRTVIASAPRVLDQLQDVEERTTIMYAGTLALNGLLSMGVRGDWATHNLEHAVSAIYDIPHGGGLAIIFPQWMRYALQKGIGAARIAQLGRTVFGMTASGDDDLQTAYKTVDALQQFWISLGAPQSFTEYEIDDSHFNEMAERTMRRGPFGRFQTLDYDDVIKIYQMCLTP
jgi:alcohol dehydrogenase YqhD (iron-dependent ADH family)